MAQTPGMAGVRGLLDYSVLLVSGASEGGVLAIAAVVTLPSAAAGLGGDVGGDGADYGAMAAGRFV